MQRELLRVRTGRRMPKNKTMSILVFCCIFLTDPIGVKAKPRRKLARLCIETCFT